MATVTITFNEEQLAAITSALARTTGGSHSPRRHIWDLLTALERSGFDYRKCAEYSMTHGFVDFESFKN